LLDSLLQEIQVWHLVLVAQPNLPQVLEVLEQLLLNQIQGLVGLELPLPSLLLGLEHQQQLNPAQGLGGLEQQLNHQQVLEGLAQLPQLVLGLEASEQLLHQLGLVGLEQQQPSLQRGLGDLEQPHRNPVLGLEVSELPQPNQAQHSEVLELPVSQVQGLEGLEQPPRQEQGLVVLGQINPLGLEQHSVPRLTQDLEPQTHKAVRQEQGLVHNQHLLGNPLTLWRACTTQCSTAAYIMMRETPS